MSFILLLSIKQFIGGTVLTIQKLKVLEPLLFVCLLYSRGGYTKAPNNIIKIGSMNASVSARARASEAKRLYSAAVAKVIAEETSVSVFYRLDRYEELRQSSSREYSGFPEWNITSKQLPTIVVFKGF